MARAIRHQLTPAEAFMAGTTTSGICHASHSTAAARPSPQQQWRGAIDPLLRAHPSYVALDRTLAADRAIFRNWTLEALDTKYSMRREMQADLCSAVPLAAASLPARCSALSSRPHAHFPRTSSSNPVPRR